MSRLTTRLLLAFSIFVAIMLIAISFKFAIEGQNGAWAVIAAALAVITSVVSSWNAQRVVELAEDKQLPYPYPYFDVKSRYGLVLLRITNFGYSSAHNIKIDMDQELTNHKGEIIKFNSGLENCDIPILLPQQDITKTVDGHIDFFKQDKNQLYTGTIHFENASGSKYKHKFLIDAEIYANTPLYENEELRTHFELQKIPGELEKISKNMKK